AQDIAARQLVRDGLVLDRSGGSKACLFKHIGEDGGQAEFGKSPGQMKVSVSWWQLYQAAATAPTHLGRRVHISASAIGFIARVRLTRITSPGALRRSPHWSIRRE